MNNKEMFFETKKKKKKKDKKMFFRFLTQKKKCKKMFFHVNVPKKKDSNMDIFSNPSLSIYLKRIREYDSKRHWKIEQTSLKKKEFQFTESHNIFWRFH